MHVRQQVRNKISDALMGISSFKKRVYESRVYPVDPKNMPTALVFTEGEVLEPVTKQHNRIVRRNIETVVYIFATANSELEDSLDPLAQQVEDEVLKDQTLGGIAVQTDLIGASLLIGGEPKAPTGAARLSFLSIVMTKQGDSQTPIVNNQGGIFS